MESANSWERGYLIGVVCVELLRVVECVHRARRLIPVALSVVRLFTPGPCGGQARPDTGETTMKRQTGKFRAVGNKGRSVEIIVWTEFLDASTFEGEGEIEGMQSFKLSDGSILNRLGKGKYEHRLTGEVFTSSDPKAP